MTDSHATAVSGSETADLVLQCFYNRDAPQSTQDQIKQLLQHVFSTPVLRLEPDWQTVALFDPANPQLVGLLMLDRSSRAEQKAPLAKEAAQADQVRPVKLWNAAVHPDYRRRGVFTRLLRHSLELLRLQAERSVLLLTLDVWADNRPAQKAYRSAGFAIVAGGTRTNLTSGHIEPFYCMQRRLPASAPKKVHGREAKASVPTDTPV